jgi:hypothetical protein
MTKRERDELLMFPWKKDEKILVNALHIQKELQQKDDFERSLIDLTRRFMAMKDKLERTRFEVFELKLNAPYYPYFEVRA